MDNGPAIFLVLSLIVIGVIGTLQFISYLNRDTSNTSEEDDVIEQAQDTVDDAEAFMERVERLSRRDIDEEDARNEDQK